MRSHAIGDTVTLTVNRDGQTVDLEVVLGSDNDDAASTETADDAADQGEESEPGWGSWIWGWGSDDGSDGGSSDGDGSGWWGGGYGWGGGSSDSGRDGGYGPGWGWGGWAADDTQQIGETA